MDAACMIPELEKLNKAYICIVRRNFANTYGNLNEMWICVVTCEFANTLETHLLLCEA